MGTKKAVKDMTSGEVDDEIKRLAEHYNISVDKGGGATATMDSLVADAARGKAEEADEAAETSKKQGAAEKQKNPTNVVQKGKPAKAKTPVVPITKPNKTPAQTNEPKPPKTPEPKPENSKTDNTPLSWRTVLAIHTAVDNDLKKVENKDLKESVRKRRIADAEERERKRLEKIKSLLNTREKWSTAGDRNTSR